MNIFIAGLSFKVNDADLANLFEEYGEITSAKVVMDRNTGRSKGYGFVEMEDNAAAEKAIAELNDAEYDGRRISVSEARPREERPRRDFNGGGNRGGGFNRNRY
jgi:RNA-binding proteins (RRM domain)